MRDNQEDLKVCDVSLEVNNIVNSIIVSSDEYSFNFNDNFSCSTYYLGELIGRVYYNQEDEVYIKELYENEKEISTKLFSFYKTYIKSKDLFSCENTVTKPYHMCNNFFSLVKSNIKNKTSFSVENSTYSFKYIDTNKIILINRISNEIIIIEKCSEKYYKINNM